MEQEARGGEGKSGKKEEEVVKGVEKRKVEENGGNEKQNWVLFGRGSDKELHCRKDGSKCSEVMRVV